jgi:hypothetical protein
MIEDARDEEAEAVGHDELLEESEQDQPRPRVMVAASTGEAVLICGRKSRALWMGPLTI